MSTACLQTPARERRSADAVLPIPDHGAGGHSGGGWAGVTVARYVAPGLRSHRLVGIQPASLAVWREYVSRSWRIRHPSADVPTTSDKWATTVVESHNDVISQRHDMRRSLLSYAVSWVIRLLCASFFGAGLVPNSDPQSDSLSVTTGEHVDVNRPGFDAGFMFETSPAGTPGVYRSGRSRIRQMGRSPGRPLHRTRRRGLLQAAPAHLAAPAFCKV